jgi:hypothetical protein
MLYHHPIIAVDPYFIVRSKNREEGKRRFVAIDLTNGKMKVLQGKTSSEGRKALYAFLGKSDKVAVEAGNVAFIWQMK